MDGKMLKKIMILNTRSLSNYHNAFPMSILSSSSDQNDAVSITQTPPDLHRQLLSSLADDSDFDFAFRLQLEEALAASASASPYFVISDFAATLNLNQTNSLDDVLRSINHNLRFHNSKKKKDRENGEGSSFSGEVFRVYFKGILAEERVRDEGGNLVPKFAGIGVAVCDSSDQVLFEVKKPVAVSGGGDGGDGGGEWIMNNRVVAVKALIEGLNAALSLGLERVVFYCDYYPLYQFVTRRWKPKQHNLAILLNQVKLLRKKFTFCKLSFVGGNDIKFACQLAREAIISQAGSSAKVESCVICLEDKDVDMIFSVDGCVHRYCFSCMKQHVEVKLLHGMVPKCPHEGCTAELIIDSCKKFLTPKLIEIMGQRLTEASIPVTEKMYCPYPKCSALMSRSEVLDYSKTIFSNADNSGVRKCIKCHGLFCVNCKVPWHSSMTCDEYRIDNPNPHAEDVKLKNLAAKNLWRQCVKCNHMIELVAGCYHMTCRCGCEFCYTCGAEWKDKKPSCNCPLWDNEHIIDDDDDEEDDDDFDEEDDDSEEYYETDSDEY